MYIPEEYVRTGRSMNSSRPANATISSSCSRMYVRFSPRIDPLRKTFSRPVKSGWNPAPTSSSAQTSVAGPRPRASTSALSERASRECTRKRRDTRSTPISPGRTVTCFLPDELGERAHEVGIRVRHLDPPQRHSELARAILRLDVDVPANLEVVGDEADRADEHVAHAASVQLAEVVEDVGAEPRVARRRLALVRERPLAHVRGLRDEPRRLEQLVLVRIAVVEGARGQRMRGEDDVRGRAADARRERVDERLEVVPALDHPQLRARVERALELLSVAGDRQARVVRREHEPDDDAGA